MYQVRRFHLEKTDQLDELARECGRLYSQTVVFFWRTVRRKGIWLKPKHLMRLYTSHALHAHTADACVQAFFASLKSWRTRKKQGNPDAHPPRRGRRYFRIEYKRSAMILRDGKLRLSNGKGNEPLLLDWRWDLPVTVVIHWTGKGYEAIATYDQEIATANHSGGVSGVDLGEIHMAVAYDGEQTRILNGRLLRSKVQYRNKLQRFKLTYKAERVGMAVALQDERYTSRTCPRCLHVRSKVKGRVFRCPKCGFSFHRDGVGAVNIRQKYLGSLPVVGAMAPPIGMRYHAHAGVARKEKRSL